MVHCLFWLLFFGIRRGRLFVFYRGCNAHKHVSSFGGFMKALDWTSDEGFLSHTQFTTAV